LHKYRVFTGIYFKNPDLPNPCRPLVKIEPYIRPLKALIISTCAEHTGKKQKHTLA